MSTKHSKLKIKEVVAYLIGFAVLLVITVRILDNPVYVKLIRSTSAVDVIISLIITFLLFFINGYIIAFLAVKQYKTPIRLVDIALLPFMMHLWSYIIPFRGGFLFSVLFLKMKYSIKGTESIAIGLYTLFISLVITGAGGVYFAYHNDMILSFWTFFSLMFLFSPMILWSMQRLLDGMALKSPSLLNTLRNIICSASTSSQKLFLSYQISTVILFLTFTSIMVYIFFIFWITLIFHIGTDLDSIVMFALMMRLSSLVRIVPGNLGIQELFSGGVFYIVGGNLNDGLAIALFVRFLSLSLTFALGTIGTAANMNHLKISEIKKAWSASTRSKSGGYRY